ncbi:fasciclin-like arabinogalactan protein 3 [Phtheirospermum japonicum]|uniref:Fasciclin-like arabinogalactan protein 3 n=1 Tax=Phtheirospermum japonicum TaxID=374723 RepID=A0A830BA46_9LAMI|nr:fasciclin-like arabinogalactan protein 3 [Phtheirospermum japonicum]
MSLSTSSAVVLLISAVFLLSTATTSAFNITRILDQNPDFSQFNGLLSQTHLADDINRRKTITVLALTNDRLGVLAGKSVDVIKRILSTHVVLDYYDVLKLNKLKGNRTVLTTLYQATGAADDQQGFLNVAHNADGISFGSAMAGAPIDSKLEGSVASQPYNISVLSVSQAIIAPGIDGTWPAPPPPKAAAAPLPPPPRCRRRPRPAPAADDAEADAPASVEAPAAAPADVDDAADNQPPPPANAAGKKMVSGVSIGLIVTLVSLWM